MKAGGRAPGLPLDTSAGSPGQGAEESAEPEARARFEALLRGPSPAGAMLAGMGGTPPPAASPAARLVEDLAQRLLVGEGEGGGDSVHVLAKDVGIPGLEISVRREAGGLVVELLAEHPADLTLLRGGAGELAGRLEARFGTRAEVRVRRRGSQGQEP